MSLLVIIFVLFVVKELQKMANDKDFSNTVREKLGDEYLDEIRNLLMNRL